MKMAERNELAMVFTREFITNEGPVTVSLPYCASCPSNAINSIPLTLRNALF